MKVVLRGPVFTQSGYGVHIRQIARCLLSRHDVELQVAALPWGNTPWFVNPDSLDGLIGQMMMRTGEVKFKPDVSFQVQLPNEWDPGLARFNIGVTAAVETDRCNPDWVEACNRMDLVIVPSEFTKSVLQNTAGSTGLRTDIIVVPESFPDEIHAEDNSIDLELDTAFNFLLVGQITGNVDTDRKNTFYTLKWLCETFADDENVGIVLKTDSGRRTKIDRLATKMALEPIIKEVRKGPFPKIHFLHGTMDDSELAALYRHDRIKALVSLTHGEGYGLPILEAAASGLPVIATNWSGHLDFMNKGKFIKVNYELGDVPKKRIDNSIFMQGSRWANPIEADAKLKLKKFKASPSIPQEWANDLADELKDTFSFAAINRQYNDIFEIIKGKL